MSQHVHARWLAALAAGIAAASAALAQPAPIAEAKPALSYRSAFEGYRPYTQDKPVAWKEANETVHQRGGWRAYAKEAAGEAGADPHAGHGGHVAPPAAEPPQKERP